MKERHLIMPNDGCLEKNEPHVYNKWASHRWRLYPITERYSGYVCADCKSTYSTSTATLAKSALLVEAEELAQLRHELEQ